MRDSRLDERFDQPRDLISPVHVRGGGGGGGGQGEASSKPHAAKSVCFLSSGLVMALVRLRLHKAQEDHDFHGHVYQKSNLSSTSQQPMRDQHGILTGPIVAVEAGQDLVRGQETPGATSGRQAHTAKRVGWPGDN